MLALRCVALCFRLCVPTTWPPPSPHPLDTPWGGVMWFDLVSVVQIEFVLLPSLRFVYDNVGM